MCQDSSRQRVGVRVVIDHRHLGHVHLVACFKQMLCNSRGSDISLLKGTMMFLQGKRLIRVIVLASVPDKDYHVQAFANCTA